MLRATAVLIVFTLMMVPRLSADNLPVEILVDNDYRPFSYEENGVARGIYIDILKQAFTRMEGFDVKFVPIPWKRGKVMMERGQGFGLTPVFYHGHDWPYLYPYSLPFYTETIIAICRTPAAEKPRPDWPKDYIGLTIGNVTGFDGWGGEAFRALVKQGRIKYEEAKGSRSNILKLIHRRVDCIMMEEKAFDYEVKKLLQEGLINEPQISGLKKSALISHDPVHIGYSKTALNKGLYPHAATFMQALDSEIYRMTKSGEIRRIMEAYEY